MSNPFEPDHDLLSRAAEKIKKFYPETEFLEVVEQGEAEVIGEEQVEDPTEVIEEAAAQEIASVGPTVRKSQKNRKPKVPYTP